MIYPDYIISIENKHIKQIKKILTSSRSFPDFLIVEGEKHAQEFKKSSNFGLLRWFVLEGRQYDFSWMDGRDITVISQKVLAYLTDVEESQGVIGLFATRYSLLNQEHLTYQSTFILDKISDPGNLGTLIRSAVALGRKNLILVDGVFPFSPKVIRASAGMIAHIKISRFTLSEISEFILQSEIKLLKMDMKSDLVSFSSLKELNNYFVLLGNEGSGVRKEFDFFVNKKISLPMAEKAESLNVAIAGSVMGYLLWGSL
jgi:TrmH family RNA methyltransferase